MVEGGGWRAECFRPQPSGNNSFASVQACQGKVAVCLGVKVLSPDIFDPGHCGTLQQWVLACSFDRLYRQPT